MNPCVEHLVCYDQRKRWCHSPEGPRRFSHARRVTMCEHASNSPEDCLLQLDDTRTSFRCVAHAPLPIPRQRDDEPDTTVPAMQADP